MFTNMTNFQIILTELGMLSAGGIGFWLGRRGVAGITEDIKADIAFIKSKLNRDLPPNPVPVPTPVVVEALPVVTTANQQPGPQTITLNIPAQTH